jgi:hypothetical protein
MNKILKALTPLVNALKNTYGDLLFRAVINDRPLLPLQCDYSVDNTNYIKLYEEGKISQSEMADIIRKHCQDTTSHSTRFISTSLTPEGAIKGALSQFDLTNQNPTIGLYILKRDNITHQIEVNKILESSPFAAEYEVIVDRYSLTDGDPSKVSELAFRSNKSVGCINIPVPLHLAGQGKSQMTPKPIEKNRKANSTKQQHAVISP